MLRYDLTMSEHAPGRYRYLGREMYSRGPGLPDQFDIIRKSPGTVDDSSVVGMSLDGGLEGGGFG